MSGPPARVAREHPGVAGGTREQVEVAVAGDEADVVDDQHRGVVRVVELGKHEHGRLLYGAAHVHRLLLTDEREEVGHRIHDRGLGRPVQHEPGRALLVVLRDEDDGATEVRVEERRRGE